LPNITAGLACPPRHGQYHASVEDALRESGIQEGLCLVNAMHITASVFINDDEAGLHQDYEKWLENLAPHAPISQYQHNRTGEDNGDAHLKRQIMGRAGKACSIKRERGRRQPCVYLHHRTRPYPPPWAGDRSRDRRPSGFRHLGADILR
jgi:thiamine phosphate synthase YjbQ (UPF0047 family)